MTISINHLSCWYDETRIIDDLSCEIVSGEFVALLGRNGSGKSTLANCMMGLIPHALPAAMQGTVTVDGNNTQKTDIATLARTVGMVFQDPSLVLIQPTVFEEIVFGVANLKLDHPQKRVKQALHDVGLTGFDNRDPHTLSEGQKQKVCIAAVLAMGTSHIILDEPISHLDYTNAVMVYDLLRKLNAEQGTTIIVIEHDTDFVYDYVDRTCILHQGRLVQDGRTKDVFAKPDEIMKCGVKPVKRLVDGQ